MFALVLVPGMPMVGTHCDLVFRGVVVGVSSNLTWWGKCSFLKVQMYVPFLTWYPQQSQIISTMGSAMANLSSASVWMVKWAGGSVLRWTFVAPMKHCHLLQNGKLLWEGGGGGVSFSEQCFQVVEEPLVHVTFDMKLAEVGFFGTVFLPHHQVGRRDDFYTVSQFVSW